MRWPALTTSMISVPRRFTCARRRRLREHGRSWARVDESLLARARLEARLRQSLRRLVEHQPHDLRHLHVARDTICAGKMTNATSRYARRTPPRWRRGRRAIGATSRASSCAASPAAAAPRTPRRCRAAAEARAAVPRRARPRGTAPSGGGSSRHSGLLGQEALDLRVVLLGLERARAVDRAVRPGARAVAAARRIERCTAPHHREIGHLQPPARVGMPAERARARARHVDQHGVHPGARPARARRPTNGTTLPRVERGARSRRMRARRANDASPANTTPAVRASSSALPPGAAQRSATVLHRRDRRVARDERRRRDPARRTAPAGRRRAP